MNTSLGYIKVSAKADSKKEGVTMKGDRYVVSVREPAQHGRANEAVRILLAKHLGIPGRTLVLVRGADKPSKLFIRHNA